MDSSVAYKRGYASSKYDLPSTRNSSKFEQQQARRITVARASFENVVILPSAQFYPMHRAAKIGVRAKQKRLT